LGAFLILNTINPNPVKINLNITPTPRLQPQQSTGSQQTPTATPINPNAPGINSLNESDVRAALGQHNVTVNKGPCTSVGQQSCTSVRDLNSQALQKIMALADKCRCATITITAGTEYWLHGNRSTDINANSTRHKPGGSTVDFSYGNAGFNVWIRDHSSVTVQSTQGNRYTLNDASGSQGATFLDETGDGDTVRHWHATFQ
ncbi:hypothetical protein KW797_01160, partial [Candidatus Parcubacteria bacterium]|nr:hypothetical protein [Candidatus Parcubacteria bacterium]